MKTNSKIVYVHYIHMYVHTHRHRLAHTENDMWAWDRNQSDASTGQEMPKIFKKSPETKRQE